MVADEAAGEGLPDESSLSWPCSCSTRVGGGVLCWDEILRLGVTRKLAVGLLSSVAMCCPKGYPEQRETKATSCVAVTAYAMFARGATRATRDGRDV